jgi:hypothetical protein
MFTGSHVQGRATASEIRTRTLTDLEHLKERTVNLSRKQFERYADPSSLG